jgi:hypothetical protein
MVWGPQNISCGWPAYAPTLAVILNLFQDLFAIGISRHQWTPAVQYNRRAAAPARMTALFDAILFDSFLFINWK